MDKKLKHYYQLKQKQKEIEQELQQLRQDIIAHCKEQDTLQLEAGGYRAALVLQERKEFEDLKLYQALPDKDMWRLLSKTDPAKVASLVKLDVITERLLEDTYTVKQITLLQVDKK